ncbi:MAG: aromatic ring-hydroxylating dioxygenase subunit alpha [Alphaproteobacteria bacterium]|nr:aromatic ring-hydroxylating dioxygenase subunit alpha [Alphaproteobacteria bacterium]
MLATKQPVLRRFWYPIMKCQDLESGPRPFRLLGQDIVVWRGADGALQAVVDRCCHRSAKLSRGFVDGNAIVCGYHGWAFNGDGACTRVPQWKDQSRKINFRIDGYKAAARYGYVWVCLGDPIADIPEFPEAAAPGFRQIDQFYEVWRCSGLRLMENSFDNSHIAFVHKESFGNIEQPEPASLEVVETPEGLDMNTVIPVMNRGLGNAVSGTEGTMTVRHTNAKWYLPFIRKLGITYPSGLRHSIVTCATPIDDEQSQIVQFVFRNDSEEQTKAADVIAFDRKVTLEDQPILESTDPDVPLDHASGEEFHMASDKPGLVMRRRMRDLLAAHGETEVRRGGVLRRDAAE